MYIYAFKRHMPRPFFYFICILSALTGINICSVQQARAQQSVIFTDDFSQDTVGHFPTHWRISDVDSDFYHGAFRQKNKRMFLVDKSGDGYCARVVPLAQPMLEPETGIPNYVGDGFKVEFDFYLSTDRASANIYFIGADHKTNYASVCEIAGDGTFYSQGWAPGYFTRYIQYPAKFDASAWHHFEAYYNNKEIKCYVDDYLLATIADCKYVPVSILTMPRGPVKLRQVRLMSGVFAKDKVAKPYTQQVADTKLFKQLPPDKAPVAATEKKQAPGNETRLFNQLPVDAKPVAVEKKQAPGNETRLFNKLPEEPKPQPPVKKTVTTNETALFNKLPEEDKPVSQLSTDKKLVSHSVYFRVNDMAVMPQSMPFISQLAQFLKDNPDMKLEIDGYTDSDGGAVYNLNLSQARADEVKRQLVTAGIQSGRLKTKGFGAAKPMKPNTSAFGKAENRRVEFIKQ